MLKTTEKIINDPIAEGENRCPMCLGVADQTMVLEAGFDKELIGSDPEKLSIKYLQNLYETTRHKQEQVLCFSCKKIFNNAKDQENLINLFPFLNDFTQNSALG